MQKSPASNISRLSIARPDDWHVHIRDGDMMAAVLPHSARQFARAIIMPNLPSPIVTSADAAAYRARISAAVPQGADFTPLMTAYLTDHSDAADLIGGHSSGILTAAKLYPAHATTGSQHGVTDIAALYPLFAAMERAGMPLLLHGEVTDRDVDIFDREAVFIERTLVPLAREFPALRIVLEHITTHQAVDFIDAAGENIAATITPQHLHINRNAMFDGGIRPHAYCLPVAKREEHRAALCRAATSGSAKYFLGTDSAPHPVGAKEAACGCAGIFNAPFALESYIQIFDDMGALDRFEAFASLNGPAFYHLPVNAARITLERAETPVPARIDAAGSHIIPFHAGEILGWRIAPQL
ncbi:MAG: dihydroorotase [Sphingomonadaceae bacterium]|nr:dihydroorotase [Sphingomonadaceae bacterium]